MQSKMCVLIFSPRNLSFFFVLLSQPVFSLKSLIYFARLIFKGDNCTYIIFFIKYALNIGLGPDTCEVICFKLGLMLDTNKFYCIIPAWMTITFTQGHSI